MHADVGWHTASAEVGSEGGGMDDVPPEVSVMEVLTKTDSGSRERWFWGRLAGNARPMHRRT